MRPIILLSVALVVAQLFSTTHRDPPDETDGSRSPDACVRRPFLLIPSFEGYSETRRGIQRPPIFAGSPSISARYRLREPCRCLVNLTKSRYNFQSGDDLFPTVH